MTMATTTARVWKPADEDLGRRRIYAGDPSSDDATYVGDREDLEPLFLDEWHQHIAPDQSLHTIRTLGQDLKDLETRLDAAVADARTAGVSWDKIGRAVGITRQGAQKRWESGLLRRTPARRPLTEGIAADMERNMHSSPAGGKWSGLEDVPNEGSANPQNRWSCLDRPQYEVQKGPGSRRGAPASQPSTLIE